MDNIEAALGLKLFDRADYVNALTSNPYRAWPFTVLLLVLALQLCVILGLFYFFGERSKPGSPTTAKTLIILGSGGHTAEMLKLVDTLDKDKYMPRMYIVAETDALSGKKALEKEKLFMPNFDPKDLALYSIPRSREVGQSYITSIGTTLYALAYAFALVWKLAPDVVLANGPGTCIPICAAAHAYRLLRLHKCKIIYIESIARVQRFSLSAKILYHTRMADLVLVQWEELVKRYPRAQCGGRLY